MSLAMPPVLFEHCPIVRLHHGKDTGHQSARLAMCTNSFRNLAIKGPFSSLGDISLPSILR